MIRKLFEMENHYNRFIMASHSKSSKNKRKTPFPYNLDESDDDMMVSIRHILKRTTMK